MDKKEIIAILTSGGVPALGEILRPKAKIKKKSLEIWTRYWLRKKGIVIPYQKKGRKPIEVEYEDK